jgi:hypothetical protein
VQVVILRKNGSYAIVATYLIADGQSVDLSDEQVEDGYYLVVRNVTQVLDHLTPAQWAALFSIEIERERNLGKSATVSTGISPN